MKVSQVRVQNYKIVRDSGWIDVDDKITTLIGKNESGKTSILEAIASFSTNSGYEDGVLHNKKEYADKGRNPVVSIRFEIEDDDPAGYHELCEDSKHGNEIQFSKFADGTKRFDIDYDPKNTSWERGRSVYSAKSRIRQLTKWLEDANANTGNLKSDLPDLKSFVHDRPNKIRSCLNTTKKKLEDKEMNDSSDLNSINDYLIAELGRLTEKLAKIESETASIFDNLVDILYYDDVSPINDRINVNSINEKDHEAILNVFEMHGIDIDNIGNIDKGDLARTISDDIRACPRNIGREIRFYGFRIHMT